MTFKMSAEAQTIKISNLRADTNEFIGFSDAYIPAHTGLPAHCTDIEPPEAISKGSVAIFDEIDNSWSVVEDYRGMKFFDKETGTAVYISEPGPLPDNLTDIAPSGEYQKWNGSEWIKDLELEKNTQIYEAEQNKKSLIKDCSDKISIIQDAIELEIATEQEKTNLLELKNRRVLLSRIDPQDAPDINWP